MAKLTPPAHKAMRPLRRAVGVLGEFGGGFMERPLSKWPVEHAWPELGDRHDIEKEDEETNCEANRHITLTPAFFLGRRQHDAFFQVAICRHRITMAGS
ncbi:hypothetical protein RZS28_10330 [Methylocapsa polymorpha]|uniref:Uncharacterized protein n=1 Tax=Methylocapsa polymorpha TaxID=3080828 RepID=A0ABZ0I0B2_9HYPH|nr:hypothetical protein RZS28_10330 [Methylocapsa sp. RX1]